MKIDYPEDMPTYVTFDEDDLPEISKWKVGKKYTLILEVEQKSLSKGKSFDPKGKDMEARFEVLSVKPMEKSTQMYSKDIVEKAMKK